MAINVYIHFLSKYVLDKIHLHAISPKYVRNAMLAKATIANGSMPAVRAEDVDTSMDETLTQTSAVCN